MNKLPRRYKLYIPFMLVGVLLLAILPISCNCSSNDGVGGDWRPTVTYTVGIRHFPTTHNPFVVEEGVADAAHIGIMYEPLVHYNDKGQILPLLASSWNYDADTMKWTINLNPDARFSDGTQVTASDVKFSIEKYIALALGQTEDMAATLKQNEGETTDALLELKDNAPNPDTIVRTGGSFITDGFAAGEMVIIDGTIDGIDKGTTGDQDGSYLIASVTATVITLDSAVQLYDEPSNWGVELTAGGPTADAITVVDDTTLAIKVETFAAMFISYLSNAVIVPKHIWSAMTNVEILAYENTNPVGSGPFVITSMVADSNVTYKARRGYWDGAPKIGVFIKNYGIMHLTKHS